MKKLLSAQRNRLANRLPLVWLITVVVGNTFGQGTARAAEGPPRLSFSTTNAVSETTVIPSSSLRLMEAPIVGQPFVQPSYSAWRAIKLGMSGETTRQLLGAPLTNALDHLFAKELDNHTFATWTYGWLYYKTEALPQPFYFRLYLRDNLVVAKEDPFGETPAAQETPSMPKLNQPKDQETLDFYPRFLDLRWTPASGRYPMEYLVEVDAQMKDGDWLTFRYKTDQPYVCIPFMGPQKARWRVKAINSVGEGAWTIYRHFAFRK